MADKLGFYFYVDSSVPDDELNIIKGVVQKVKPLIYARIGFESLHCAQPTFEGNNCAKSGLLHPPNQAFEHLTRSEDGNTLLNQLYKDLKSCYTHSRMIRPRSFIYLTNGASLLAGHKTLKDEIVTTMFELAKRKHAPLPYREIGITFLQFGNVDGVQDLFESLDSDLQEPFEARLREEEKAGLDKGDGEAIKSYLSQTDDDKRKEDYYNRFDIVDYVRVNSVADVDKQMVNKIIFGAIDPKPDQVDILKALRPQILENDKDATLHYFQSDGNLACREFPDTDPEKSDEAIEGFLEASGNGNDHIDAFVSALESYHKYPNRVPRNLIWITKGESQVARKENLIKDIVRIMTLEAERGEKLISTRGGDPRYRPCGATFVQIGDHGAATQLFHKLSDNLQSAFKSEIYHKNPSSMHELAREHYENGQVSDPKYYEKRLRIVRHVKVASFGDLQRQFDKILIGGIDSKHLEELQLD
ncbi:hypothetical protein PG993_008053 [Apiospora rasikravindrae]|uniref:VWFA domain-containing protein n=1 Tax=Apiospora rasikravindrae TaxID=990691 RepID=A0ABR1SZ89_9PEZI